MEGVISFNAAFDFLIEDARLRPRKASELLPAWKSSLPAKARKGEEVGRTARVCPAMDDFLHAGYVIPLWTDIWLQRVRPEPSGKAIADPDGEHIRWYTGQRHFPLEFHAYEQVAGAKPLEPPYNINKVVKPLCPWLVETPPGWSILVLPLYLHESEQQLPLEPLPGIINTDHWHQIHTPCKWRNVLPVMQLRAGTPFMHIIPIRRHESLAPEFNLITDKERRRTLVGPPMDSPGAYRRQQRVAEEKAKSMREEGLAKPDQNES